MRTGLIFNDTLNLNLEQGFPAELLLNKHQQTPYSINDVVGRVYSFKKPELRFYNPQPSPVFLVQNIDGQWIYWGMAHVLSVTLDYVTKTTSGQFKIVDLFSPADMENAYRIKGQPA